MKIKIPIEELIKMNIEGAGGAANAARLA